MLLYVPCQWKCTGPLNSQPEEELHIPLCDSEERGDEDPNGV